MQCYTNNVTKLFVLAFCATWYDAMLPSILSIVKNHLWQLIRMFFVIETSSSFWWPHCISNKNWRKLLLTFKKIGMDTLHCLHQYRDPVDPVSIYLVMWPRRFGTSPKPLVPPIDHIVSVGMMLLGLGPSVLHLANSITHWWLVSIIIIISHAKCALTAYTCPFLCCWATAAQYKWHTLSGATSFNALCL